MEVAPSEAISGWVWIYLSQTRWIYLSQPRAILKNQSLRGTRKLWERQEDIFGILKHSLAKERWKLLKLFQTKLTWKIATRVRAAWGWIALRRHLPKAPRSHLFIVVCHKHHNFRQHLPRAPRSHLLIVAWHKHHHFNLGLWSRDDDLILAPSLIVRILHQLSPPDSDQPWIGFFWGNVLHKLLTSNSGPSCNIALSQSPSFKNRLGDLRNPNWEIWEI